MGLWCGGRGGCVWAEVGWREERKSDEGGRGGGLEKR
jgi:hypothetical protein